jgi:hypothetical protein
LNLLTKTPSVTGFYENLPQLEQLRQLVIDRGAYAWQVQLGSDMGNMRKNSHMLIKSEKIPHVEQQIAQMIRKGPLCQESCRIKQL